jgi:DNA polymerase I-like protein with 3'-5' exonuclease and polymerase domains
MPRINVHDDLSFILRDDSDLELRIQRIAAIMAKARFPWLIVPLMIEVSVGYNWADVSEICKITGDHY